jgi:hypothetical protein
MCAQASTTSMLPLLSIAFSNGYFAYDTWDMIQVCKPLAAASPLPTQLCYPQFN